VPVPWQDEHVDLAPKAIAHRSHFGGALAVIASSSSSSPRRLDRVVVGAQTPQNEHLGLGLPAARPLASNAGFANYTSPHRAPLCGLQLRIRCFRRRFHPP